MNSCEGGKVENMYIYKIFITLLLRCSLKICLIKTLLRKIQLKKKNN